MKTDAEVQMMLHERKKGKTLEQVAAKAGMPPSRKPFFPFPRELLRQPLEYELSG